MEGIGSMHESPRCNKAWPKKCWGCLISMAMSGCWISAAGMAETPAHWRRVCHKAVWSAWISRPTWSTLPAPSMPLPHPKFTFQVAAARHLPFGPEFDLVVSFNALHWVPEQELALRSIHAALKPEAQVKLRMVFRGERRAWNDFQQIYLIPSVGFGISHRQATRICTSRLRSRH